MPRIAFLGAGVMGEAIVRGLLDRGEAQAAAITVSDVVPARLDHLRASYGVYATGDNAAAAGGAEVIVLSVKPQTFPHLAEELRGRLEAGQLVLSIMAGVPIKRIAAGLDHTRIVRVMPNTPAQIGRGVSVWTATPAVSDEQRAQTGRILR